jgi:hypothetical protein
LIGINFEINCISNEFLRPWQVSGPVSVHYVIREDIKKICAVICLSSAVDSKLNPVPPWFMIFTQNTRDEYVSVRYLCYEPSYLCLVVTSVTSYFRSCNCKRFFFSTCLLVLYSVHHNYLEGSLPTQAQSWLRQLPFTSRPVNPFMADPSVLPRVSLERPFSPPPSHPVCYLSI